VISVLIFTRDDSEWLSRCLTSLAERPPREEFEVLVFDNVSQDSTAKVVRGWRGPRGMRASLLQATEDTSFSRGNNLLIQAARGDIGLILNPDTEPQGDLIDDAAALLREDLSVVCVGPRLVFPDGSDQSNGWALPTPVQLLRERLARSQRTIPPHKSSQTDVGWLMGCFLMVRTSDLRHVDGFDERYWFFGTDLELCSRLGHIGRLVRLDEHLLVHRGHKGWPASRRQATRKATLQWMLRSVPGWLTR